MQHITDENHPACCFHHLEILYQTSGSTARTNGLARETGKDESIIAEMILSLSSFRSLRLRESMTFDQCLSRTEERDLVVVTGSLHVPKPHLRHGYV